MRLHLGRLLLKNDALGCALGGTKQTPQNAGAVLSTELSVGWVVF